MPSRSLLISPVSAMSFIVKSSSSEEGKCIDRDIKTRLCLLKRAKIFLTMSFPAPPPADLAESASPPSLSPSDPSYSHEYPSFLAGLTAPVIPHGSIFIDLSLRDAAFAYNATKKIWNRDHLKADIIEQWRSLGHVTANRSHGNNLLITLSVRSALDLFLTCQRYPQGSLVLIGAVNIPDVATVIRAHGLVPVPIDIDVDAFDMRPDLLEAALQLYGTLPPHCQPATVASAAANALAPNAAVSSVLAAVSAEPPRVAFVLTAHIFGRITDVTPLITLCCKHSVPFVEDLAEALVGNHQRCFGHPDSDVTLHSFGTSKVLFQKITPNDIV